MSVKNKSFLKTSQELNTIVGEAVRTTFNKKVRLKQISYTRYYRFKRRRVYNNILFAL